MAIVGGGDQPQAAAADAALQQAEEEIRRAVPGGRTGQDHWAFLQWLMETGVDWHYIASGKHTRNAMIESIDGKLRDECRNTSLFGSLAVALERIEAWRIDGNTILSHSSIAS